MTGEQLGRRRMLTRSAGIGVAAAAAGLALTGGRAFADDAEIEKAKADVKTAYDNAVAEVEKLGDKVTDATKSTYDEIKKGLDDIGAKIDEAGTKTGSDAKRAYRDIQHELRDFSRDIDHVWHDAEDGVKDAWRELGGWFNDLHDEFDHLLDGF